MDPRGVIERQFAVRTDIVSLPCRFRSCRRSLLEGHAIVAGGSDGWQSSLLATKSNFDGRRYLHRWCTRHQRRSVATSTFRSLPLPSISLVCSYDALHRPFRSRCSGLRCVRGYEAKSDRE
jgi:hypothetical protein